MSYQYSWDVIADDPQVTRRQARAEVEAHSADWLEFLAEHGSHDSYSGAAVLAWLGY